MGLDVGGPFLDVGSFDDGDPFLDVRVFGSWGFIFGRWDPFWMWGDKFLVVVGHFLDTVFFSSGFNPRCAVDLQWHVINIRVHSRANNS